MYMYIVHVDHVGDDDDGDVIECMRMMMMMVTFWAWSPCTRLCTGWGKGRWHSRQGSGHMASWWNETQIDTNKFQNFSLSPYPREDLICFTHFETEKTAFWSPNGTGVSLVNTISLKAFMKRKELHEDSVPSYSNLVLTRPWRVGLFDFGSGLTKKFGFRVRVLCILWS